MLWYKSWLETRWRFVIGLVLMIASASATVLAYPEILKLMPLVPTDVSGELGRRIIEAAELSRSYRGYVWSNWFRVNLLQLSTIFAVLLGTGGLLAQVSGGGALFTLSLPATRRRLLGIRAATGLAELFALALIPSLLLLLLSPLIGQSYGIGDALIHALCVFVGGSIFFSLAFLLATVFSDVWRPLLLALCVAFAIGLFEQLFRDFARYSVFGLMSGEAYFRNGEFPWLGLVVSAVISLALLFAATKNIARQDF